MIDRVEVKTDKLEGVIADTAAIQAVDLLTKEEIDLLRDITSSSPQKLQQLVKDANVDPVRKGMLSQLSDLGFIYGFKVTSGDIVGCEPTPKAAWAISRYDKRIEMKSKQEKKERQQRRFDRYATLGGIALGWLLGLASPFVIEWLSRF